MNKYEIMFIVKTTVDEAKVKKTVDSLKSVISDNKGKIIYFKEMGQKKLAYEINKEVNGFYYLLVCDASSETIVEFERRAKLDENLIRYLVINLDKE